jgi:uncharacterized protein (TIGR03118 family)
MTALRRRTTHGGRRPAAARRWSPRWLVAVGAMAAFGVTGAGIVHAGPSAPSFQQRNLVSDIAGVARVTDPNLVNPWGLAAGPQTPLWVADNGADVSTLVSGGVQGSAPTIPSLVVRIPGGAPTGAVFNPTNGFVVRQGGTTGPARFIFDSETGRITAWTPSTPPATEAKLVRTTPEAVYKGLGFATTGDGPRLFAADFHGAKVDVFDDRFAPVMRSGAFRDPDLPAGYAPFNVQELGGKLYVTYAKQDEARHDDVAGEGLGIVDVYDTSGRLLKRLITGGELNAPWGLALAPADWGGLGGALLVGNFGDGMINAYNPQTGAFLGKLKNEDGNPIQIDGLWALRFGNGVIGTERTLLFSAGIAGEKHGLLGEFLPTGER